MGVNKLIVNGVAKFDISKDTVDEEHLLKDYTAHDHNGDLVTGGCTFDADTSDATLTADKLLAGETGYAGGVKITGNIPNKGAVSLTLTERDTGVTIPRGFHDGSGKVGLSPADIAEIIPENIREGIDILGIMGSMSGTEGVKAENREVTPTMTDQVVTPNTTAGYNYLAKVTVKAIPIVESPTAGGGTTITIG